MEKIILVFYIIVFQLIVQDSLYDKENTCHRQSMCKQTVLKVKNWVISNSIFLELMNPKNKTVFVLITGVFETH